MVKRLACPTSDLKVGGLRPEKGVNNFKREG